MKQRFPFYIVSAKSPNQTLPHFAGDADSKSEAELLINFHSEHGQVNISLKEVTEESLRENGNETHYAVAAGV